MINPLKNTNYLNARTSYVCDHCGTHDFPNDGGNITKTCEYCGEEFFEEGVPLKEHRFPSRYTKATIMHINRDFTHINQDFFPNHASVDQGLINDTDHSRFHRACFSEYAYWNGRNMVALQEKRRQDKKWFLKEEYLLSKLSFKNSEEATRLSQAWEALNFDARTARTLIEGHGEPHYKDYKHGLKNEESMTKWVDYFEGMAFELDISSESNLEHYRQLAYKDAQRLFDNGKFPQEMTLKDFGRVQSFIEVNAHIEYTDSINEKLKLLDEETNTESEHPDFNTHAFTGHPLQNESDRCKFSYTNDLRQHLKENPQDISAFKQKLYKGEGSLRWLSYSQKSELWNLVKSL